MFKTLKGLAKAGIEMASDLRTAVARPADQADARRENDELRDGSEELQHLLANASLELKAKNALLLEAAEEIELLRKKNLQIFATISKFEVQRDEWKNLWWDQAQEHLNAQHDLEMALSTARQMATNLLAALNQYRMKAKEKPIEGAIPKEYSDPVGVSVKYWAHIEKVKREHTTLLSAEEEKKKLKEAGCAEA